MIMLSIFQQLCKQVLVHKGINCKFTVVALYLFAVKQELRYKKTYKSYPGIRVLVPRGLKCKIAECEK